MLFTKDAASELADGTITVTFRTWSRPQARVAGRYRTWGLLLQVDSIDLVDIASVKDRDAIRAGYASADALRLGLDRQRLDGKVWRVEFHCVGADDRLARRNDDSLDSDKLAMLEARTERLDKASASGPWTRSTLKLIEAHPGVVSTELARQMNTERLVFKTNVRKLKELGLTESLEIGYRLSPLGEAFLRRTSR